jgi:hypothetical protein
MTSNNLLSAVQLKEETLGKLRSESELGGILGPFSSISISTLNLTRIYNESRKADFMSIFAKKRSLSQVIYFV